MSPLLSLKSAGRRSASPRETRDFSFNDVTFSHAEDDHSPDMNNYVPSSRPLTVAIPEGFKAVGAYCPRRPNLAEILSNQSPPPWTLSAFMAYLSHNHCLETLEFTMDAKRYRQHFEKASSKSPGGQIAPGSEQSVHMNSLWQRLMQAYILPNGAREVNLPSYVKDALLSQDTNLLPPHPDSLKIAIEKVHELMEESVLVPFLNSLSPQTALPDSNSSSVEDLTVSSSYDERGLFRSKTSRKNRRRGSPLNGSPTLSASTPVTSASPPVMPPQPHRASAPSAIAQFARNLSHSARHHNLPIPHSNSNPPTRPVSGVNALTGPADSSPPSTAVSPQLDSNGLQYHPDGTPPLAMPHDDSTSTRSVSGEPMTPPTTPPMGDLGLSPISAGGVAERTGNPWKRMRYSFGWRKKNEHGQEYEGM